MNIPQNHQAVMPYLMLHNAAGFTQFMQDVFGATLSFSHLREDNATIMHAEVEVSGCTIMFCDATTQWPAQTANLFIYVPDADAAYQLALEKGATSIMEPADKDYGRTCGVTDPFGNTWWITAVQA